MQKRVSIGCRVGINPSRNQSRSEFQEYCESRVKHPAFEQGKKKRVKVVRKQDESKAMAVVETVFTLSGHVAKSGAGSTLHASMQV